MTCLTELIEHDIPNDTIKKVLEYWEPLPDILFYCFVDLNTVLERANSRKNKDIYDMEDQIIKYHTLYEKAYNYIRENTNIEIIKIDTSRELAESILSVENIISKNFNE
jgi:thymidylate kinase